MFDIITICLYFIILWIFIYVRSVDILKFRIDCTIWCLEHIYIFISFGRLQYYFIFFKFRNILYFKKLLLTVIYVIDFMSNKLFRIIVVFKWTIFTSYKCINIIVFLYFVNIYFFFWQNVFRSNKYLWIICFIFLMFIKIRLLLTLTPFRCFVNLLVKDFFIRELV